MFTPSAETQAIRNRIDHPILDTDGHAIEYLPIVYELMKEIAGQNVVDGFKMYAESGRMLPSLDEEQARMMGASRTSWWALPTETLDRATVMLPGLFYDRMDEVGLDFAMIYPTYGLIPSGIDDDELRQASSRAFNQYFASEYAPYKDRMDAPACIPCHTPEEAIAELDYAVLELGFKAVMLGGIVRRPLPGNNEARAAMWIDTLGVNSAHDYSPLWQRCVELKVAPTFHSSGMGWGTRNDKHSYIFNKIGSFAASQEALCRSLFFAGVAKKFPELRFGFLEAGTAWACNLYSDLFAHWEKRNVNAMQHYNPARTDRKELASLFEKYGSDAMRASLHELENSLHPLSDPQDEVSDEFAGSMIEGPEGISEVFARNFFFGCEADDRMNATGFNPKLTPDGVKLNAIFASDIGHWDVPDVRDVLPESYELVEEGLMTEEDYCNFTFTNPARMWADANPDFFKGTVVESAVSKLLNEL